MSANGWLKRAYHRISARTVATILRPGATYMPENFELWQRHNYHILPLHFYSPIPDTGMLAASKLWQQARDLAGIDWNLDCQIEHLAKLFPPFGAELADELDHGWLKRFRFSLANDAFVGADPAILYAFIRNYRPRTVIEIGSGHSSRVMAAAMSKNGRGELISIDPFPSDQLVVEMSDFSHTIIRRQVEQLQSCFFDRLDSDDVLFIDSTHTVRTGGDVNFLFLEVLPRLKPGVIIHLHDIFLPEEYPREWLLKKHVFWAEQYLLHAFLLFNSSFEILMANHYLANEHPDLLRQCFPRLLSWGGASFWIRRVA